MSLNMFKNRLYNTIIAVSLVIAIAVVTSYVPEMFEKRNDADVKASNEIKYEEPQIRVESAKKSLQLSKTANALTVVSSKQETKNKIERLGKAISDLKDSINDEVTDAKKKSKSDIISKRADDYKSKAIEGLDSISEKIESLNENVSSLSDKETEIQIKEIKKEIEDIQAVEVPEVKYNDEAHGQIQGYNPSNIVGEQLVKSNISPMTEPTENKSVSYLELNDELKELADTFDTPAQIYEYVRNNYMYKQYTGLRLGAIGTYQQRAGNDLDQAALLIALFRYKGYDAKFVIGNVDIDINKAMNWLGVNTEQAAVDAMSMLGVPTQYGKDEEGNITKLRIEHVWVNVKVPYDSYRGAGKVSGKEIWVELDPSYKQFEDEVEENNLEYFLNSEFDKYNKFNSDLFVESLENVDFTDIYNINGYTKKESSWRSVYTKIQKDLIKYSEDKEIKIEELADILGIRTIIKDESGYLPASLPYSVVEAKYQYESLDVSYIDTIAFSLQSALYGNVFAGEYDETIEFYSYDLYGHDVSLVYEPATDDDKRIIDYYGGLFATPSYLVRVVPVVKIDGNTVLQGKATIPGTYTNLVIDIKEAEIEPVKVENALVAGGVYGVTFDYNTINDNGLGIKDGKAQACLDKLKSGEMTVTEGTVALSNMLGKTYFALLDMYDQIIAHDYDVQCGRCISECVVGYKPKQSALFGIPIAISDGTLYIDVDTDTVGLVYNNSGDKSLSDNEKMYMISSGMVGSYLEGFVMEEATGTQGISSISIIAEAKERGIDIVTLSAENETLLDELDINASTKSQIKTAISNGKVVIVPKEEMFYYDWYGTGYISLNPDTGEAAYMISGGLCGGESLDFPMTLFVIFVAVAAVLGLMAFEYMALSAFAGVFSIMLGVTSTGIEILDLCVLILGLVGAGLAMAEMGFFCQDVYDFFKNPTVKDGMTITTKSFTAVVSAMIFEYTLPKLFPSGGYDKKRLYNKLSQSEFFDDVINVTDDYVDDVIKTVDDYVDDIIDATDDVADDYVDDVIDATDDIADDCVDDVIDATDDETYTFIKNEDVQLSSGMSDDEFWRAANDRYGKEIANQINRFGDEGRDLLEKYGDNLVRLINDMSPEEAKQALQLINEYGDDAFKLLKEGKTSATVRKIIETVYGKSSSNITKLLENRLELTGTNREKLLSIVQDSKLATYINEVYRPGASIGDGGTADALISEFFEGNSTHLLKAQERLKGINKIIDSGNLGLNDLDIAEAIRDDLEFAIGLFD
ncbi:MAG: hypothetical protein K6G88_14445 [Lachnospiraceae bacterium]|nr:hypothetical protein [Lachnospiraceae bacterium]